METKDKPITTLPGKTVEVEVKDGELKPKDDVNLSPGDIVEFHIEVYELPIVNVGNIVKNWYLNQLDGDYIKPIYYNYDKDKKYIFIQLEIIELPPDQAGQTAFPFIGGKITLKMLLKTFGTAVSGFFILQIIREFRAVVTSKPGSASIKYITYGIGAFLGIRLINLIRDWRG